MVQLRVLDISQLCSLAGEAEAAAEAGDVPDSVSAQVQEAVASRTPFVLRGLDIGQSEAAWRPEQLAASQQPVTVHVSECGDLDFLAKNFVYRKLTLGELATRSARCTQPEGEYFLAPGEKYYLRALGEDQRREPADLRRQFPSLAAALHTPPLFAADNFFSSVLRVASAGLRLWLHYDVMDNVLCGLAGTKRVTLYSPYDAQYLYLRGDKSLVANPDACDLERFPLFAKATPFVGDLLPGDALYIPAMWFHSVLNLSQTVSVNVFWRRLQRELHDAKDAYGNREPLPVARLRHSLVSGLKATEQLPPEFRHVYGVQLAELVTAAMCDSQPL